MNKRQATGALLGALVLCGVTGARADVLRVGKGKAFEKPSQAAAAAKDGDTVEIDAGLYSGDVAIWRANNLTIRGIGGKAHLDANGQNAEGKATWVIKGGHTTVENIEFSGAAVRDKNGAGIRQEGDSLTVRHCFFHDNEDGILGGNGPTCDMRIENSEFYNNGNGDGYSHNMYIGHARSLTLIGCFTHHTKEGHNIKTRAATNYILYNRVLDEQDGTASYSVDVPNGGATYLIGNVIQKGPGAHNTVLLHYAEEGASNPVQELYVINNTFVNQRGNGVFIRIKGAPTTARIMNNIFAGGGTLLDGTAESSHNVTAGLEIFTDAAKFNYHLAPGSPAIGAGVKPEPAGTMDLMPKFESSAPLGTRPRPAASPLDAGAFAFQRG